MRELASVIDAAAPTGDRRDESCTHSHDGANSWSQTWSRARPGRCTRAETSQSSVGLRNRRSQVRILSGALTKYLLRPTFLVRRGRVVPPDRATMGTEWEHEASSRDLALVSDRNHGSDACHASASCSGSSRRGASSTACPALSGGVSRILDADAASTSWCARCREKPHRSRQ